MTTYRRAINTGKQWYNTGNPIYKNRLIDLYDDLTTEEIERADALIGQWMPEWIIGL